MEDEIEEPESSSSALKTIGNGNDGGGGATAADDKCNQVASMSTLGRLVVSMTLLCVMILMS